MLAALAALLTGACQAAPPTAAPGLRRAARDGLVSAAVPMETGGSAWRSAIQAPHFQTDRDVGAAGVANGLLALADVTDDRQERDTYLAAARQAADFLVGAQDGAPGAGRTTAIRTGPAVMAYTSFDDGAAGIADLLWTMGERTGDERYRTAALAGIDWVVSRAEGVDDVDCPEMCRWAWSDDGELSYRNGMGEGQAGIVYALSVFAERTGDARYAEYARGGAAYLESVLDDDGGMPESDTEGARNTGYLSGAAGAAYAFLRMYVSTGDAHWLDVARRPLAFLDDTATQAGDGVSWPIMVDAGGEEADPEPGDRDGGGRRRDRVGLPAGPRHHRRRAPPRARPSGRAVAVGGRAGGGGRPCVGGVRGQRPRPLRAQQRGRRAPAGTCDDLGRVTGDGDSCRPRRTRRSWLVAIGREGGDGRWSWHGTRADGEWTLAASRRGTGARRASSPSWPGWTAGRSTAPACSRHWCRCSRSADVCGAVTCSGRASRGPRARRPVRPVPRRGVRGR